MKKPCSRSEGAEGFPIGDAMRGRRGKKREMRSRQHKI